MTARRAALGLGLLALTCASLLIGAADLGAGQGAHLLVVSRLPRTAAALLSGAGLALAWNHRTMPRSEIVEAATAAGFDVADARDERFVHRVDRSITRDVLVGRRPAR